MVTIKMIAKKCGYSVATVSKALNGAPDVNAETAARIRKTAAEMGYLPNAAARMLKTSRSYNFGVLFEDATNAGLTHEYFSHILESFKHRAEELGYDISFISNRLGKTDVRYTEHARYRNYDGIVVASVDYTNPDVVELASSGIPMVVIDYSFPTCGSIYSDNVRGVKTLVEYVHSMGHRRIAFICGDDTSVTRSRVESFYQTCKDLDIQVPEGYVIESQYHHPEKAAAATRTLMALKEAPTCIFYPDDISYIGGRAALMEMGLSIPGDVSAVGYDGISLSQLMTPPLTTLHQDAHALGRQAAEELARAVEEGKAYIPRSVLIPGELLPGGSVKRI